MKYNSIWEQYNKHSIENKKLPSEVVDILIIGGGITGLTLSYLLKDYSQKVVIIDKGKIGNSVTSRSTAKISFLQQDIYQKLEKTFDYETSKKYYESQMYAIELLKNIIEKNKISCDFLDSPSYLFTNMENNIKSLEKEKQLLTSFGVECFDSDELPIKFPVKKVFYTKNNYTFNPVKYLNKLVNIIKSNIEIYENVCAENINYENNNYIIETSQGKIKAKKVVIANQYPFFIKPGFIPFRNYMKREYVNAASIDKKYQFNAINIDDELHSIRFYNKYLIYVSNSHRIVNKLDSEKNYQKAQDNFYKYFNLKPEYSWLNQDLITNDHLPIIGEVKKDLFISTGYNAWGMTNGVLGAKIIHDLLEKTNNEFTDLVKPNRINTIGIFNSIIDSLSYIKPYIEAPFHNNDIYVEEDNGIKYNVYVDSKGIKHRVKRKCPHLKCNLIFNKKELTWDCPCHGSRFDLDGKLIEGPSKKDI